MFKPGHPVVYFNGPDTGAGGGTPAGGNPPAPPAGGNPPPPSPPAATALPWGSDPNTRWTIGDKPWYDVVYPDGPTKELMRQKDYANPLVLGDSYFNINKLVSSEDKRILIPAQDAKPEEWDAFYNKLGRPEKPDAYDFEKSLKLPQGTELDTELVTYGKTTAHKLGLNKVQAQGMAEAFQELEEKRNSAAAQAFTERNTQEMQALETKYGAELNAKKAAGQRVAQALGMDAEYIGRIEQHIGAAPIVDLLVRLGSAGAEGSFVNGGSGGGGDPTTMTPEAAAAKITSLRGDVEFQKKYGDNNHPEHKEAMALMEKLYARAGDKAPL